MGMFEYEAVAESGARIRGEIAGASEQVVLSELATRSLTPIRVQEKAAPKKTRGVSVRELGEKYLQLGEMLAVGVPLMRALTLLAKGKTGSALAEVFRRLADHTRDGGEVAEAMANEPSVFKATHVAMVRAGERGGFIDQAFVRLGQMVLAQAELKDKVVGSLIYPCVIILFGMIVLGVVFGVFVPMFEPVFARLADEGRLPAVSQVVFAVSDLIGPLGLIPLAIVIGGGWWLTRRPEVRLWIGTNVLRVPVLGPLMLSLATARFCRVLGTLLQSGVSLLTCLEIARTSLGNAVLAGRVASVVDAVREGEELAPAMRTCGVFNTQITEMVAVGEAAGHVDQVLLRAAETLETRVDRQLSGATKLIEPLLLVGIGGTVAVVAVALILPLMELSSGL